MSENMAANSLRGKTKSLVGGIMPHGGASFRFNRSVIQRSASHVRFRLLEKACLIRGSFDCSAVG